MVTAKRVVGALRVGWSCRVAATLSQEADGSNVELTRTQIDDIMNAAIAKKRVGETEEGLQLEIEIPKRC